MLIIGRRAGQIRSKILRNVFNCNRLLMPYASFDKLAIIDHCELFINLDFTLTFQTIPMRPISTDDISANFAIGMANAGRGRYLRVFCQLLLRKW